MDNTKKFTDKADKYNQSRPSYPDAMIKFIEKYFDKNTIIADIGSGTGILTKQLLKTASCIYTVEPNDNMRLIAESNLSSCNNFYSIKATAENTTLLDNSVDIITVAQAFHWFDVLSFKKECQRILKPNGKIFLIWNTRDESANINKELFSICKQYCPDFIGFSGGIENNDTKIKTFFDNDYTTETFPNQLYYNRENFINRALSSSYSINQDNQNYAAYINALNNLFDKYQNNEIIEVANTTKVIYK